jgi:periplasmic copper chaperone A
MRPIFSLFAALLAVTASSAHARDYRVGSLDISDPWSRATPKGAAVGGGYLKIKNGGTTPDRLTGGSSDVAAKVEVHTMTMDNGVMKMRPVEGGLEIKPGATVELKPGSYHLMFVGLKKPLAAGDHVKATLTFEKAGPVDVELDVKSMGGAGGHDMPGMKMQGH